MKTPLDPHQKPEALGTEISVRAGLDESGISLKAKSRAFTAFDKLIGAAIDIPGLWLERRAERARLTAVTEQEAMKIDAKAFLKQRKVKQLEGFSAEPVWLKDARRCIDNRVEVVSYAIEEIKAIDSMEKPASEAEEIVDDTFEDWLNVFSHRAGMATSEVMRSIFGRILAGEVLKAGSFSIATLRIVAELDQRTATNFQDLCLRRFEERELLKVMSELNGKRMFDLIELEERGLIKEVGGTASKVLYKHSDGLYYLGRRINF